MARQYTVIEQIRVDDVGPVELVLAEGAQTEEVLLKRLHPHLAMEAKTAERFLDRAKKVAKLDDPGICPVIDVGTDKKGPFFASQKPSGESFTSVIEQLSKEAPARVLDVACQIIAIAAQTLESIREDIEPFGISADRITIGRDGVVTLMFGGVLAEGDSDGGDIFTLGVLLWDLVQKDESGQQPAATGLEELPTIEDDGSAADQRLAHLVGRAMAWGERFSSLGEMGSAFQEHLRKKGAQMDSRALGELMEELFVEEVEGHTLPVPAASPATSSPAPIMADRGHTGVSRLPEGLFASKPAEPTAEATDEDMAPTLMGVGSMSAEISAQARALSASPPQEEVHDTKLVLPPTPVSPRSPKPAPAPAPASAPTPTPPAPRAPPPQNPLLSPANRKYFFLGGVLLLLAMIVLLIATVATR